MTAYASSVGVPVEKVSRMSLCDQELIRLKPQSGRGWGIEEFEAAQ